MLILTVLKNALDVRRRHRSMPMIRPSVGGMALLLLGVGALGQPGLLHAQEADSLEQTAQKQQRQRYRVETTDGNVIVGTLISESGQEVVLKTKKLGEVTLKRSDIAKMEALDSARFRDGEYWYQNPQSTRYFFAPNAIGIPKGEGYYQNTWIFLNNVNYGVSNNFSMGAGTIPVFLFGADSFPIWFLPKISVSTPQKNLHLAGGAVLGGVLGTGENSSGIGVLYGSATVGSRDNNASLSIGYGYTDGEFADVPLINVSGMTRLGQDFYLLSENYFAPDLEGAIVSLGFRWAPRNFALDVGLFRPLPTEVDFVGLPWLGVTVPFGR